MKRILDPKTWLALAAAILLAGCAQMGVLPADTFNKKLAAGYTSVAAVADSAAIGVHSGVLSKDKAATVLAGINTAVIGLDAAAGMRAADPAGAATRLDATIAALTALQAFLAAQGVAK